MILLATANNTLAVVDGSAPPAQDSGHGFGPVARSGGLGFVLAGVIMAIVTGVASSLGHTLDPFLISNVTTLLGGLLGMIFMYFTPSKKVIEVIEVVTNQDLDNDGITGPVVNINVPETGTVPIIVEDKE